MFKFIPRKVRIVKGDYNDITLEYVLDVIAWFKKIAKGYLDITSPGKYCSKCGQRLRKET